MKDNEPKEGLFKRLFGSRKPTGCSCCGNYIIEEIPDNPGENTETNPNPSEKNSSDGNNCCHN